MNELTVIKCLNPRCNAEYRQNNVTTYAGFSCPACGFDKYKKVKIQLPKKRKDRIKFIKELL